MSVARKVSCKRLIQTGKLAAQLSTRQSTQKRATDSAINPRTERNWNEMFVAAASCVFMWTTGFRSVAALSIFEWCNCDSRLSIKTWDKKSSHRPPGDRQDCETRGESIKSRAATCNCYCCFSLFSLVRSLDNHHRAPIESDGKIDYAKRRSLMTVQAKWNRFTLTHFTDSASAFGRNLSAMQWLARIIDVKIEIKRRENCAALDGFYSAFMASCALQNDSVVNLLCDFNAQFFSPIPYER